MKIFIDTAQTSEIHEAFQTGLVDGVTTNPSLIMKSGRDPEDVYQELIEAGIPDISMEVVGTVGEMYNEGIRLAEKFGDQATIKLPCTRDGLQVYRDLTAKDIRTNVTLIFSASQAVLAAKAGATYISPFVGRLTDNGFDGLELIRTIYEIYKKDGCPTEILAASVRSPEVVALCYREGADICTIPPGVFNKMYESVLTREGLAIFQKDWDSIQK